MATWLEDVVASLEKLGGIGTLSEIYETVQHLRPLHIPKVSRLLYEEQLN